VATIHLLCGLPGSGKTTVARRLEREHAAVRFTLDEWMLALFDLGPYDSAYGPQADRVKELIWRTAQQVIALGHDVVLDWSHWNRTARASALERAQALGADVVLHYVDVPLGVVQERVLGRNTSAPGASVHRIDLDDLSRFASDLFEPPALEEGIPGSPSDPFEPGSGVIPEHWPRRAGRGSAGREK
jgi:predicted kinase